MPKILEVTWPKPRNFLWKICVRPLGFPKTKLHTKFDVPSSVVLKICSNRMPKILGFTWPKPRPFWGKLFVRHNVVIIGYNWIKICNLAKIGTYNRCAKNRLQIFNHLQKNDKISWPQGRFFWLTLYNFQGATMMTKGSLLFSVSIVKHFRAKNGRCACAVSHDL